MRIAREEVFGPVLSVIPFEDEDGAIAIANDTQLRPGRRRLDPRHRTAFRISASRCEAGTVWVNTYRATSYLSPFGGYKRSGIGRESGLTAIREYLQERKHLDRYGRRSAQPLRPTLAGIVAGQGHG